MNWLRKLRGKIRFNEPLRKHTSFKVGGMCSIWFEPKDIQDLAVCMRGVQKHRIPFFVLGAGTNVLFKDAGFKGLIIKLSYSCFKNFTIKRNIVSIGAGMELSKVVQRLTKSGFTGYEYLAGIPGTIGGALMMNAGTTNHSKRYQIAGIVYKLKVMDNKGRVSYVFKKDLHFRYRSSGLHKYIVLEACLVLKIGRSLEAKNRIKMFLSDRKLQDYSRPSAGCVFKNPSKSLPAALLIDRCGLKGLRCGGAMVSRKHANFILNYDDASSSDIIRLIKLIKDQVRDKCNIKLNEEIKIVS